MKKTVVYSELIETIYKFSEYDIRAALLSKIESRGFNSENCKIEFLYGNHDEVIGAKVVILHKQRKKEEK